MKTVITFLFVWGCVGYSLGTGVLLGPVRWVSGRLRDSGGSETVEKLIVLAIVALYVATSVAVAAWLTRVIRRSPRLHVKLGLASIVLVAATGALWLWMTPSALLVDRGEEQEVGSAFTFGPYPDAARLAELKQNGYTAVISLLHPAVVPFEPKLLADERRDAAEVGIELLHLPMLPWVGNNEESLDRLEALAQNHDARYYVHCYLGRDRVRLARTIVERSLGQPAAERSGPAEIEIADGDALERGRVYALEPGVLLIPYPTEEEFAAWIVHGTWGAVVSLMRPESEDDRPWIEKEREVLGRYRIRFEQLPLASSPIDSGEVLEAVRQARQLPRPLLIHSFLSPSTGRSPVAEAFLQAWRSDLPPVPPSGFGEGLVNGPVRGLAPNILSGPRPQGREFWTLRRHGIRRVVYLGDAGAEAAMLDRSAAAEAPLPWSAQVALDETWIASLADEGPWYLYGPGLQQVDARLIDRYGPAIPLETKPELIAAVAPGHPPTEPEPRAVIERASDEPASSEEASAWWLARFLPSPRQVILMGPWMLLLATVAARFAGWLAVSKKVRTPYTRKIFHFVIFTLAAALHVTAGLPAVVLFSSLVAAMVIYSVWRGDGFPMFEALARPTDAPRRGAFVLIPLVTTAAGGVMANLLFGAFAPVGYLVGGWGDAAAEPVGTRWGRRRYKVPSLFGVPATRTLEGSTAVACVGTAAAFIALLVVGFPPSQAGLTAVACGLLGAGVEAISHHGLDNLTIQLAAAGMAFLLLG